MMHLNIVTVCALLCWPLVALYLFGTRSIATATIWTILGGYLVLPVGADIKFQMVPAFNKISIPSLSAMACCIIFAPRMKRTTSGFGAVEFLALIFVASPIVTALLNSDPINIEATHLPGVGIYDGISTAIGQIIFLLPFLLGRNFLNGADHNIEILRALVIAGLCYSLPMLFEMRMSPQLHDWIYGYFPTDFDQEVRDGGYRPVVFLGHGLLVAFFAATATIASAALWRTNTKIRRFAPSGVTSYLSFILLLCKTGTALLYGTIALPLVRWGSPRLQVRVACLLVCITLAYPLLRVADLVPTNSIIQLASSISADRAASLGTRFYWERELLDRAWERPWFGWGRYGRNRVYNGWEGADNSRTDGAWIITLGSFGLVGFVAQFGLLGLSVYRAAAALKFTRNMGESIYLAALVLILAVNLLDLLPNASLSPWTWLIAGALAGRAEQLSAFRNRVVRLPESAVLAGRPTS